MKQLFCILLGFTAVLVLFRCGESSDDEQVASPPDQPFLGTHTDYEPASGPRVLAARSDLVISGMTGKPHEGRIWGISPNDPGAVHSVVVPVTVDSYLKNATKVSGDTLYTEIFVNDGPARESIDESLGGREAVLYLSGYPANIQQAAEIVNPKAGRPAGAPLFQLTTPQGLLIETADGNVWSVGEAEMYSDVELSDFDVTSRRFSEGA